MRCMHCETDNSIDSLFCRHCGRRLLVRRQPDRAVVDFEKLINDGYDAVHEGRPAEALLAVEGILRSDPFNTSALALKALVHERTGEVELAIDTYEQLVTLNPESNQDKRRLMELKAHRIVGMNATPHRRRTSSVIPALAAGGALLVGLIAFTIWIARGPSVNAATDNKTDVGAGSPPTVVQGQAPNPNLQNDSRQQPSYNPYGYQPSPTVQQPATTSRDPNPESLPTDALVPPLNVSIRDATPTKEKPSETVPSNGGSVVMPDKGNTAPAENGGQPSKSDQKPSIIDIKVTQGSQKPSTTVTADQESLNYYKIGRAEREQGNYRAAIVAYQKALQGASYRGYIHKDIAICHYRLGDKTAAATAYENAISEYNRQIRDNVDVQGARSGLAVAQSGLRLCRQ